MSAPDPSTIDVLTEKEKETLRLIVRGHDAKSAANELDLSVHTINERLRSARRKLDVTSSREAARILLESEAVGCEATPERLVYEAFGDAGQPPSRDDPPIDAFRSNGALMTGGIAMIVVSALALALSFAGSAADPHVGQPATAETAAQLGEFESAARDWLEMADEADWRGTYEAASSTFRGGVSLEGWEAAAQARTAFGDVARRAPEQVNVVESSGKDYQVVMFRTEFANGASAIERVTLEYEGGRFRVSGYWIDSPPQGASSESSASADARAAALTATSFMGMIDAERWADSYAATGENFRRSNTLERWTEVSEAIWTPLGDMVDRKEIANQFVPGEPGGYQVVKFASSYADGTNQVETVSLVWEDGAWKIAGIVIG